MKPVDADSWNWRPSTMPPRRRAANTLPPPNGRYHETSPVPLLKNSDSDVPNSFEADVRISPRIDVPRVGLTRLSVRTRANVALATPSVASSLMLARDVGSQRLNSEQ